MSESNVNPQALLATTMPSLLPAGFVCGGAHIGMQLRPAANILLLPPELIRTRSIAGDIGVVEVFIKGEPGEAENHPPGAIAGEWDPTAEKWRTVPAGMELHELGTPLPPEKCNVIFRVMSAAVDTLAKGIIRPGEQRAGRQESVVGHQILAITPLDVFQRAHVENLRGPTT